MMNTGLIYLFLSLFIPNIKGEKGRVGGLGLLRYALIVIKMLISNGINR